MEIDLFHWSGLDYLFNAHKRLYWPYLFSAIGIAWISVRVNGQFRASYLSHEIWWHNSARLDYQYFVISNLIKLWLIYPFALNANEVAFITIKTLDILLGYVGDHQPPTYIVLITYTLSLFIVGDLTRYWLHRLMHSIPTLWEIHKVHHSAEVLTPITFYRVHPVESLLFGLRYAVSIGLVTGVFIYAFGAGLGVVNILGVNVFIACTHILGDNLRHSPIRLRYPASFERWMISPAQHQFHHCISGNQFNFGGVLAVWDRLFNSLRISQANECYNFGLKQNQSSQSYRSISDLLFKPMMILFPRSRKPLSRLISFTLLILGASFLTSFNSSQADMSRQQAINELGRTLYSDKNLSFNRRQSCASCHNPEAGFIDDRDNIVDSAASLGDDEKSIGDRNAPANAYALLAPEFHFNEKQQRYIGGMFWDGRAGNLVEQAKGPFLNPIEMGMPDVDSIIERLTESEYYQRSFPDLFGKEILSKPDEAFNAVASSIASFENTKPFAPFDSKYDRYLRGEYELTDEEDLGMSIFFSTTNSNCSNCHVLNVMGDEGEPFSNFEFHNVGTPANTKLRTNNGVGENHQDFGLFLNPAVSDDKTKGQFKVPGLRNIAITAPYMHNGVFIKLRTVVEFYDQYNNTARKLNPETGKPWANAEVLENIVLDDLKAKKLSDKKIDALIAFMKTLTDRRYEHLLAD